MPRGLPITSTSPSGRLLKRFSSTVRNSRITKSPMCYIIYMTHGYKIKSIPGYEQDYKIDSEGNVWKRLKGSIKTSGGWEGYKTTILSLNGKKESASIHRLVAEAFIPNPEGKPYVNHINHSKADNRVGNLEWCTQQENAQHAAQSKRSKNGPIVPVVAIARDGTRKEFPSIKKAAETLGNKNRSVIRRAILRDGSAYGYKWERLTASGSEPEAGGIT
jgi:hypothetical protein